jgi:predicted transcriptional regulator
MALKTTAEPKRRYARDPQNDATNIIASSPAAPRRRSKISIVLSLMQRENGATLAEMMKATDWLAHTTRAALTGLKKRGHTFSKDKRDGATCYHAAKDAE